MNTATLFISAVTDEFKSCRDAVTRWLDGPGMRIETQEKFLALGQTTLLKLSEYIRQCDVVVHLVGDRTGNASGSVANPREIQCLLEAYRDLPHSLGLADEAINSLSYTQWEAWLAIYHRKRLFIAVPEAAAPRDAQLKDEGASKAQLENQRAHLAALAVRGCYPEIRFATSDQLCLGLVPLRDLLVRGTRNELGLTNILSLSEYRASLAGFRRFLSSNNLPFRAPPPDHPCHPEELLKRLATSVDAKGVLLAGAGGVGKTRTTFETAQLAESRGWRVICALPGQPGVTAEKIVEAVLAHGPGKTMVVIEYLDQMQDLDLGVLRRHLIQTSAQHGIQFGLMANCRPGLLLKVHPEREAIFETIKLAPSPLEAETLSRYVVVHTAPRALRILGERELLRLCGCRTIIALLVAQQLEQIGEQSRLQPGDFAAVRSGDLGHWLRRRLAEDKLVVPQPESVWEMAPPPSHLVAAATALACAPDEESALTAAAASALRTIGKPDSTAPRVTAVLVAVGWLERADLTLHAVHDVVADELTEQCIFELDTLHSSELRALLSPALTRARSFGRLAKTFTRVEGALSPERISTLHSAIGVWVNERAQQIGQTLAADEANNGSYALGAVLGGSVFEDFAIEAWPDLVTPWLARHRTTYEARHLLFRGLRAHHERMHGELIPIAVAWLERWRTGQPASFVFGPLLRVISADVPESARIIGWSLAWLARFPDKLETEFVLVPLLGRADLRDKAALQAITRALQWLQQFPEEPETGFVLPPLLGRSDLSGEGATQAIARALHWLDVFPDKRETAFVLAALLKRGNVQGEAAAQDISRALYWLDRFRDIPEAGFVLAPLLGRADLPGTIATRVITQALLWLDRFPDRLEAQFVLNSLLGRADLPGPAATQAIRQALLWLDRFPDKFEAQFVLNSLLGRADLPGTIATQVITQALLWLDRFPDKFEAQFVLNSLLGRADLPGTAATQAITRALFWLGRFPAHEGTDFILKSVLGRPDLQGEAAVQAIARALHWLTLFSGKPEAGFVLAPLLGRADLQGEAATQAIARALYWLERFPTHEGTDFTLNGLLSRADLQSAAATQAIMRALLWLERFPAHEGTDFILKSILARADLQGEVATQAIMRALLWLAQFPEKAEARFVLGPLLRQANLKGAAATQAITRALRWLARFPEQAEAGFVLAPLLRRAELRGTAATQAVARALQWLEPLPDQPEVGFVLEPLLRQPALSGVSGTRAIARAIRWLERFLDKPEAGFVLGPLLGRTDVKGEAAAQAITRALHWLQLFSHKSEARFVLHPLLGRTDLEGEAAAQAITRALHWLECFPDMPETAFVLAPLWRRPELNGDAATQASARALRWLERFGREEKAGFVLVEWFLGPLAAYVPASVRTLALEWSSHHPRCASGAPALILKLCVLGPDDPDREKTMMAALEWVETHPRHLLVPQVLLALLKHHADMDGVVDGAVTTLLDMGWRNSRRAVGKPLSVALHLLPVSDSRRDEIEVLLESED